jgi:malate permease and related proteins
VEYGPIVRSLSTLAVIVVLGWLSRRRNILTAQDTRSLSTFLYTFSLPALFFSEIARFHLQGFGVLPVLVSLLPLAAICGILFILRALRILSKERVVLYGLSVAFGSYAFFGAPFFESLYGKKGLDMAVFTGSFLSIFGLIMSITLFEYAGRAGKGAGFILRVLRSPLIISIVLGLMVSVFMPQLRFLADICAPLGRVASGLAIFLLGMFIYDRFSLSAVRSALPLALFRVVVLPAVTLLALYWSSAALETEMKRFLLLQSGIPCAISVAIFADRYEKGVGVLTGMVVLTSIASFLTLGILYVAGLKLF